MANTRSISEIVNKACELKTKEEKIAWLKGNNSQALRTILTVMYDKDNYVWNLPNDTPPPYTPSPHVESHGMLYRQTRKLRYFIKGFDGDNLSQYRREALFIELLETIDKNDAEFMVKVLMQKPLEGLDAEVINEALGLSLPVTPKAQTAKRGRKPKNG